MRRIQFCCVLALTGVGAPFLPALPAFAHGIVGNRFFPATLAVDDPFVADELSLPTFSAFKNADGANERDIAYDYSKRITSVFAVSVGSSWTHLQPGGSGWQNVETAFKYQFLTDAMHELIVSAGVNVEWGATGAMRVGAERFNTITPTLFFGKGFGDLPDALGFMRPFAITGQVGYAVPSQPKKAIFGFDDDGNPTVDFEHHAEHLIWGATLQYSLPYLKANVVDLGLPEFFNHLVPLVEARLRTPTANNFTHEKTTGTINPGVVWAGQKIQVGIEALIPINRESGRHIGVIGQLHFYLDDIFPQSLGKPLI